MTDKTAEGYDLVRPPLHILHLDGEKKVQGGLHLGGEDNDREGCSLGRSPASAKERSNIRNLLNSDKRFYFKPDGRVHYQ